VDPRRFGRVWCLRDLDPKVPDAAMEAAGLTPLGPEALDLNPETFAALLQTNRPIKSLLLDQSRIAGLGNIYADESLWAACIHPARAGSSLTAAEAAVLLREIQKVLRRAIRAGGTTFSDFRNVYGDMGRFRNRLKVYGRQGEPCPRCGTTIQYLRASGRGTHICPRCQVSGMPSEVRTKPKSVAPATGCPAVPWAVSLSYIRIDYVGPGKRGQDGLANFELRTALLPCPLPDRSRGRARQRVGLGVLDAEAQEDDPAVAVTHLHQRGFVPEALLGPNPAALQQHGVGVPPDHLDGETRFGTAGVRRLRFLGLFDDLKGLGPREVPGRPFRHPVADRMLPVDPDPQQRPGAEEVLRLLVAQGIADGDVEVFYREVARVVDTDQCATRRGEGL
jgi:hypothetical protein